MKSLFLVLILASPLAHSIEMKPGLWKVKMVIKTNGKEIAPQTEMQKALDKMPEAKRKKMMEMMGQVTSPGESAGVDVCFSKAMIEKPESMGKQQDKKCTSKVTKNNPKEVVTTFKCEDGTKGDATWSAPNPTTYTGVVNVLSPKGEKSQINYKGDYAASECGKVKPII